MTEATKRALEGLRDLSTMQWYAIPILAIVFYIYTMEIKRAREGGGWDAIIAGAALFGADFFNENWNGWVLALTGRAALWTAPGPSAFRTTVGWNLEIMLMFALLGLIFYHSLSPKRDAKILGLRETWFFGILYSLVCVVVELALNAGGALVWEYSFWNRSLLGVIPIFLIGYFWFFAWVILVLSRKTMRAKLSFALLPYGAGALLALVAAILGWRY